MTLSDRVAVFNQGRIEQLASPQALYDAPANPFVASFLGDNNMASGVLEGLVASVESTAAATLATLTTTGGQRLQARSRAAHALSPKATVTLCVRPEFLTVAAHRTVLTTPNGVTGTLVDLIHQGDHWRLVVRLDGMGANASGEVPQWFAKISPGALPQGLVVGQNVCLGFCPEDAWVF
jgi:putative spermidine/putrescine transport system ATP-binding protein